MENGVSIPTINKCSIYQIAKRCFLCCEKATEYYLLNSYPFFVVVVVGRIEVKGKRCYAVYFSLRCLIFRPISKRPNNEYEQAESKERRTNSSSSSSGNNIKLDLVPLVFSKYSHKHTYRTVTSIYLKTGISEDILVWGSFFQCVRGITTETLAHDPEQFCCCCCLRLHLLIQHWIRVCMFRPCC